MVKIISIKCPACGAALSVGSDRTTYDCEFCGTRVKVHDNDAEHMRAEQEMHYREMEMRQRAAQTDREYRYKEWEQQQRFQEEQEFRAQEMERKNKEADAMLGLKIFGASILMLFALISLMMCMVPPYFIGVICLLITVAVGIAIFVIPMLIKNNKQPKASGMEYSGNDNTVQYNCLNGVEITSEMVSCIGKLYGSVGYLFAGAGFTNITAVPLKDLVPENNAFNGQVVSVLINGKQEYHVGNKYPRETSVVITYHSVYDM